MSRNNSWDACLSPKLMLRHLATKASGCTSVPLLRVIPWFSTGAYAAAGVAGPARRPGSSARAVKRRMHHCTGVPVYRYRTTLWPRYPLRSSWWYGHPASTYSAVFSRANSAFCLLGQGEQSVLDAGLAGTAPAHVLAHEFNGQVGAARFRRGRFPRVIAAECRGVAVAQLVVGLASQTYEHRFSHSLIPQPVAPFMAPPPRP